MTRESPSSGPIRPAGSLVTGAESRLFEEAQKAFQLDGLEKMLVETGLFVGRTDLLIVGTANGVETYPATRT